MVLQLGMKAKVKYMWIVQREHMIFENFLYIPKLKTNDNRENCVSKPFILVAFWSLNFIINHYFLHVIMMLCPKLRFPLHFKMEEVVTNN